MNRQYQIILDGQLINDEPMGLTEAELTITRDEKLKGIFFNYTSDLTFFGDGYQILLAKRNTGAGCGAVNCLIQYDCNQTGNYDVLFEGVINVGSGDMEWDEYNCMVKTKIENADFNNFLQTFGDFEFRVNSQFCIDGVTPLTPITQNLTDMIVDLNGATTTQPSQNYLFIDVLRQCLTFLTNGQVNLDEDSLYNVPFQRQIIEMQLPNPIGTYASIDINFINYYGQNIQFNTVTPGSAASFRGIVHKNQINAPNALTANQDRNNYLGMANYYDETNIRFENIAPWRSWSIVPDYGTADLVEIQPYQYGLKNLAITNKSGLVFQGVTLTCTLNQLMLHASQLHNMGFYIVRNGTTFDFRLRFYPDMVANNFTSVNLTNVNGITSKASGDFGAKTISTPSGKTDNFYKKFSWTTDACFGGKLQIEGEGFSSNDIYNTFSNPSEDEDLIFFFLKEGDYTLPDIHLVSIAYTTTPFFPQLSTQYMYNAQYMMPIVISRYTLFAGANDLKGQIDTSFYLFLVTSNTSCANCPDAVIPADNQIRLRNVYSFEHQLSFAQIQLLLTNTLDYVNFSDNRGFAKSGYIKEIKIPFKDFIASFEVYSS